MADLLLKNLQFDLFFSVQIESLEEKHLPARSLKIMAEAFAIKGLCYEKLPLQVQNSMHSYLQCKQMILACESSLSLGQVHIKR